MIRGTTPCLGTKCDMNLTQFTNYCTVWQGDTKYVIEPEVVMVDDMCYVYCQLTQEQTLSFEPNKPYHAQMRSVDENGFAVASFEYTGFVHDVNFDGTIPLETQSNTRALPTEEQTEDEPKEESEEEPEVEEEQPEPEEPPVEEEENNENVR